MKVDGCFLEINANSSLNVDLLNMQQTAFLYGEKNMRNVQ